MSQPPFRVVLKTDPLTEEFLPSEFVSRQAQLREMLEVMTLPGYRGRGIVAWLHGPPGSGKSSTTRWLLHQLEERSIRTAYVNCWSHQTFFSVLEAILVDLSVMARVTRDSAFRFERLHTLARRQPLAIVLDEVDMMLPGERDSLLYNLSHLPNAKVLCLTHSREPYIHLDPRVHSRVQPLFMEFAAYSPDQIVRILQARAEQSLAPDSWCIADLETIAAASEGDARIAIQALRAAAYLAEKHHSPQLRPADIHEGLATSSQLRRRYALNGLSEHHRLIYAVIKSAGEVDLSVAWDAYRRVAREQGIEPMERRTFNQYRQFLVASKLLTQRYAKGRRNVLLLKVVE